MTSAPGLSRCALAFALLVTAAMGGAIAATPGPCNVTVFPRHGTYVPTKHLHGPGLILNGGGALEGPAAAWFIVHDRIIGSGTRRAGNVIVLRASDADLYDQLFLKSGNFASMQTVLIPPCASRAAVDSVAPIVDHADILFFAGGDQSHYTIWKGSALIAAVKRVYARGGAVGGGSAGLAIQGAAIYDSASADRLGNDTHTADAVKYPLEPRISFTTDFFAWPALEHTITDTHFAKRDRFGRSVVFLARLIHDRTLGNVAPLYALGVDQASVVLVDRHGIGTVFNGPPPGASGVFLIRASQTPHLAQGAPIRYAVDVSHIARNGETFDVLHKTTN
ncbi:MAG: hypothetical protein M3N13_10915, partial [Candidatus Eremiobacteraeota bacterium]|nr:hypothetical protein [Candidatus Eremiobacteraeota bacterium]